MNLSMWERRRCGAIGCKHELATHACVRCETLLCKKHREDCPCAYMDVPQEPRVVALVDEQGEIARALSTATFNAKRFEEAYRTVLGAAAERTKARLDAEDRAAAAEERALAAESRVYGAEVERAVAEAVARVEIERDAWRIVAMTGTVPSDLVGVIGAEAAGNYLGASAHRRNDQHQRDAAATREACAALLEQAAEERETAAGQTDDAAQHHDLCTRAMHLRGAALIVRTGETWPKVPARAAEGT